MGAQTRGSRRARQGSLTSPGLLKLTSGRRRPVSPGSWRRDRSSGKTPPWPRSRWPRSWQELESRGVGGPAPLARAGMTQGEAAGQGSAGSGWAHVGGSPSRGAIRGGAPPPRGGAGVPLPGTPPARARAAPLTGARRRPAATSMRTGPGRAETGRPRARGAGSSRMLGRPRGRGLFIAPGHHVSGVAGDRQATQLVVAPTPAA